MKMLMMMLMLVVDSLSLLKNRLLFFPYLVSCPFLVPFRVLQRLVIVKLFLLIDSVFDLPYDTCRRRSQLYQLAFTRRYPERIVLQVMPFDITNSYARN